MLAKTEEQYYQEFLAMSHEELAQLAVKMRSAGEKLEEQYQVLYQSCEAKMETMANQAQEAVCQTVKYACCYSLLTSQTA
jgi:hypothetical protein